MIIIQIMIAIMIIIQAFLMGMQLDSYLCDKKRARYGGETGKGVRK